MDPGNRQLERMIWSIEQELTVSSLSMISPIEQELTVSSLSMISPIEQELTVSSLPMILIEHLTVSSLPMISQHNQGEPSEGQLQRQTR